jgi:hypothetical protein
MPEQDPKTNKDSYSPRAVLLALGVILLLVLGCLSSVACTYFIRFAMPHSVRIA